MDFEKRVTPQLDQEVITLEPGKAYREALWVLNESDEYTCIVYGEKIGPGTARCFYWNGTSWVPYT